MEIGGECTYQLRGLLFDVLVRLHGLQGGFDFVGVLERTGAGEDGYVIPGLARYSMLCTEVAIVNEGMKERPAILIVTPPLGDVLGVRADHTAMKETSWRRILPLLAWAMSKAVNNEHVRCGVLANNSKKFGIAILAQENECTDTRRSVLYAPGLSTGAAPKYCGVACVSWPVERFCIPSDRSGGIGDREV